jgi:hypothetical protein
MINLAIFFASLLTHRLSSVYPNLAFIFQGAQTDCDLYFQTDLLSYFITFTVQNSRARYVFFYIHKEFHGYRFLFLIRAI